MRKYQTRLLAVLLIEILLLCGCGVSASQGVVVELIEPVAANAAYRPVELGTIGESKVLYGTVIAQEYCCFYDTAVNVEKVVVDIGDYVEAGDIVAYADIDSAREELEDLRLQLQNLQQNYELETQISELEVMQIAARIIPVEEVAERYACGNERLRNILLEKSMIEDNVSGNDVSGNNVLDEAMIAKVRKEYQAEIAELQDRKWADIAIAQENLHYAELLHEYRISNLQEMINAKEQIIADGTLRASHSGQVVYVKEMGKGTYASAYENIVVLADQSETYIELDMTIDKYAYKDYEVKYLRLAGKIYEVTELSYGVEAEVFAKASGRLPRVRLICPDAPKLTVGEMYPILYRETQTEEVPVIGLDSLQGEEGAYFVYVKTESGEREKRFVTIGEKDKYYAEVLSGLEIGELVYYESDARMPADYMEYTVELSDYNIQNLSRSYQLADEQVIWYEAQCSGMITELAVKKGDEVEAGDLLYVIMSDDGRAALADAVNQINRENITYEETIARIDKSLATENVAYGKEILTLQKELETINHDYRLCQMEENYNDMLEKNNGNGEVRVYAEQSGVVTGIEFEEDEEVSEGYHVLSIGRKAEDKLLVQMVGLKEIRNYPDNIAEVGEKVIITAGEHDYAGVCVGWTAHMDTNLDKYYVSETKDGPKISFCIESQYSNPAFYVELENDSLYQNLPKGDLTFNYVAMEDVVVVPTAMVYEEKNALNPTRTDYFVWRVVGDELVKQYVLMNKAYSDMNNTLILSGVKEHDVLAREK